jgi:hypothetical protein
MNSFTDAATNHNDDQILVTWPSDILFKTDLDTANEQISNDNSNQNCLPTLLMFYSYYYTLTTKCKKKIRKDIKRSRKHVNADYYIKLGLLDGKFEREYGMDVNAFLKLELT